VCGLDHSPLDEQWADCRERPMAYPLWQYAHQVVSVAAVPLLTLDYEAAARAAAPPPEPPAPPRRVRLALAPAATRIDAVALRVEWDLGGSGTADEAGAPYVSPYARHEVCFLPRPRRAAEGPLEMEVGVAGGRVQLAFV
jgi:hypothetical protein